MSMRRVGAHRDVHGDGDFGSVGAQQQAVLRELRLRNVGETAAECFTDPDAVANARGDGEVHLASRFFRRAKASIGEDRLYVFTRVARNRNFEVMNCGGTVHGEGSSETAPHKVEQDWREPA